MNDYFESSSETDDDQDHLNDFGDTNEIIYDGASVNVGKVKLLLNLLIAQ